LALKNIISLQYGMNIKSMKQLQNEFLIKTAKAEYIAKKVKLSPAEIVFIYHCQEHLKENRFVSFEKIVPTKDGCPYLRFDKSIYVLIEHFQKEPIEIIEKEISSCIEFINMFHAASTNLTSTIGARYKASYGKDRIAARNMYSVFTKIKQNPRLIKNESLKKVILKTIDKNIEYVEKATKILEDDSYLSIIRRSMQENRFIHGKLTLQNIVKSYNKLRLLNMFDVELNIREKDIATFIKSLLKRNKDLDFDEIIGRFYITSFDQYRQKLILALLLLPYEYFSVVKKVLKLGNLEWASKGFEEKINRICERDEYKHKILASLH